MEGQTYLVYVDDSGSDSYDVLSALCIPTPDWTEYLERWRKFRRWMERKYGVPLSEEFHSIDVGAVSPRRPLGGIDLNYDKRSHIATSALKTIASMASLRILTVYRDAQAGPDLYEDLLDQVGRFCEHYDSWAIVWYDGTDVALLRERRTAHRSFTYDRRVLEDPHALDSKSSSLIQMADVAAYVSYQRILQTSTGSKGGSMLRNGYSFLEDLMWCGFDGAGAPLVGMHAVV